MAKGSDMMRWLSLLSSALRATSLTARGFKNREVLRTVFSRFPDDERVLQNIHLVTHAAEISGRYNAAGITFPG